MKLIRNLVIREMSGIKKRIKFVISAYSSVFAMSNWGSKRHRGCWLPAVL